jgi:hypothetical protein
LLFGSVARSSMGSSGERLVVLGEATWIALLFVLVYWAVLASWPMLVRAATFVIGIGLIIAHFEGYKLYGSASIHDNRPVLDSPHELASFVAPNILTAKDGTRIEVRDVTFTPRLLETPVELLRLGLIRTGDSILIQLDASSPSGVVVQRRRGYPCGNSFVPSFFPARLPAYSKVDLGELLIDGNYAASNGRQ